MNQTCLVTGLLVVVGATPVNLKPDPRWSSYMELLMIAIMVVQLAVTAYAAWKSVKKPEG